MSDYNIERVVRTNKLRDVYGDEIVLSEDGRDQDAAHRIVLEFDLNGRSYVVLRPERAGDDGETSLFRVTPGEGGEYDIETIEDDDEWEAVSELVDEMTVSFSKE